MIRRGLCREAAEIRTEVFVREQGFEEEFDRIDPAALHVVLFEAGEAAATGRLFTEADAQRAERAGADGERTCTAETAQKKAVLPETPGRETHVRQERQIPPDRLYHIGRVAVRKKFRGRALGRAVMEALEREARVRGGEKIVLSAQLRAAGFYERLGYHRVGEVYLDESCPHIRMEKPLAPSCEE